MAKTVVITGANRGIGLELVKRYVSLGYRVYGICRSSSKELERSGALIIDNVDVTKAEAVQYLVESLENISIDVLINNAGILRDESLDEMDFGSIQQQFEVNALAPLRVTQALLAKMKAGAKIAFITSRMGSIADNSSGGRYGYRMSKAALNAAATSLAVDLKSLSISVAILHPGYVQTEMVNGRGDITPYEAANRLVGLIDQLDITNSGTFWHSNGETLPW